MADLASRQRSFRLAVVVIATAGMASWLSPTPVRGQKHDSEARAAGPATDPQAEFEERYRRAEILASDQWRRAMFELDEWLAVQPVYTPEQVRQIRAGLANRVASMSSYDLDYLLDTLDFKLRILTSPEATEAREWLGHYLSVMADSKRASLLRELPDVVEMTSGELIAGIQAVKAKRAAVEKQARQVMRGRREIAAFVRESRADDEATKARMARIRRGEAAFSPYRNQPVGDPPFANSYDSPTVIGVGPWGTFVGMSVGAF
jgi:hypothetical protein